MPLDDLKPIADEMGISLYQRFTLNEASLFLRFPERDLGLLVKRCEIEYIQVTKKEVQFFGYQLLQYLLDHVSTTQLKPATEPPRGNKEVKDRIIRSKEVQQITGLSRTTIWRLERKGAFPARVVLSEASVGWRLSDVEGWLKGR